MAAYLVEAANRVPGLTPYVRVVLEKLAYHAKNGDQTCWPTVKGIAKGMCMSEREVMRSLKTLRQQKLITKVGTSLTNDAVIYRVNVVSTFHKKAGAVDIDLSGKSKGSISPKGQDGTDCQAEGAGVTDGQIKQVKKFRKTNKKKEDKTSAADAVLAGAQKPKTKTGSEEKVEKKSHSQLVQVWIAAHQKAGYPAPEITSEIGKQLNFLANANPPTAYDIVRDKLIPQIVSRWNHFCMYAKYKGVHFKSSAPMPPVPSAGFLLKYKLLAIEFWEMDKGDWDALKAMLGDVMPATGALPPQMPKPKNWNSPIWKGHSTDSKKA